MALTLQRLGTRPSLAVCNPYYKLVQITQQHELDVGCYSPEARTSINPVYPCLRNCPRLDTQSEKFTAGS
jgi:hypothetical protein